MMQRNDRGRRPSDYDPAAFPPFAVAVDLAIFTVDEGVLKVLLVERAQEPFLESWALPGGFVLEDESVEDAARRELTEETGLADAGHLEQLRTYGDPDRDPRMRVVSIAHVALLADPPAPIGGGDANAARYWPVDDLALPGRRRRDALPLAFDHGRIVDDARERVRSKLEYTTLGATFVGKRFTLADLRRVYGAVWGNVPDLANFRRKVLSTPGFVEPIEGSRHGEAGGGRPAQLYRRGRANELHPPMLRPDGNLEQAAD